MKAGTNLLNTLLYAAMTALAALMFLWLFNLFATKLESIEWALLISATLAAAGVVLFLTLRWYASVKVKALAEEAVSSGRAFVEQLASTDPSAPVSRGDIRTLYDEVWRLAPAAIRIASVVLTAAMLITVLGEIVLLANAAVAYLQAERLRQQNDLLSKQNDLAEETLLNTSISTLSALVSEADKVRQTTEEVRDSVLAPISIAMNLSSSMVVSMPDVADLVEIRDDRVAVICKPPGASCSAVSVEALAEASKAGTLEISVANRSTLLAYFGLTAALQFVAQPMWTEGSQPDANQSLNDLDAAYSARLAEMGRVCAMEPVGRDRLIRLWDALSAVSMASTNMWPDGTRSILEQGMRLEFASVTAARVNFLQLAAAGGALRKALGEQFDSVADGPQQYADIVNRAVAALREASEALLAACEAKEATVGANVAVLERRRAEIVTRLVGRESTSTPR